MSTKFGQHIRIDHNSIFLKWKLDNPLKDALDKTDPGHQTGGVIRPAGLTRLTGVTRPISPICIEYTLYIVQDRW